MGSNPTPSASAKDRLSFFEAVLLALMPRDLGGVGRTRDEFGQRRFPHPPQSFRSASWSRRMAELWVGTVGPDHRRSNR